MKKTSVKLIMNKYNKKVIYYMLLSISTIDTKETLIPLIGSRFILPY